MYHAFEIKNKLHLLAFSPFWKLPFASSGGGFVSSFVKIRVLDQIIFSKSSLHFHYIVCQHYFPWDFYIQGCFFIFNWIWFSVSKEKDKTESVHAQTTPSRLLVRRPSYPNDNRRILITVGHVVNSDHINII